MLKIFTIIALIIIVGVDAASWSCNSCGGECVSACGTRRFRTCCFNYLRRKRGPDTNKLEYFPEYIEDYQIPRASLLHEEPVHQLRDIISRDITPHFKPYAIE